jgi:hypothetical protein
MMIRRIDMTLKMSFYLKYLKVLILIACLTSIAFPQSTKVPTTNEGLPQKDLTLEKFSLVAELQYLDKETLKFSDPLSEALAKIEIADAAWELDRNWAKKLIRVAYELTLPKTDQLSEQNRSAGSIPPPPNAANRLRWKIRFRALAIARRDKDFANELTQMGKESLGAYGRHFASAALADQAMEAGDVSASADHILEGIKADPTQGTAPEIINRIAMRDRALADRLILQYIGELRRFPISSENQSDRRSFSILSSLVSPYLTHDPSIKVPPPGSEVMRACISYMLETLKNLEQQEPGYLLRRRLTLLSLWLPLQQYAPELASTFLNLESRSRKPGDSSSLPTAAGIEAERRLRYERNIKKGLESEKPDEAPIYSAISSRDFDKARKMIDKLPDGAQKKYLTDAVNAEEALGLTKKGSIYEAERLAKELIRAASILQVYPALISKCTAKKDQTCAHRLVYQALRQVKDSDTSPPPVPEGIPPSAVATNPRFDPVLSFIAKLAIEVLPASDELAFYVLDEFVSVANTTPIEAEQARIGFDVSVFKKLVPKNETHVQQAAHSLKNPVQRVLALAAIYQWKIKELIAKQSNSVKADQ